MRPRQPPDDAPTGGTEENPELAYLMKDLDLTEAEANAFMTAQHELSVYAQSIKHDPGYISFGFTGDRVKDRGVLILEPDAAGNALRANVPVGVEIRLASRARGERAADLEAIKVAARAVLGDVPHDASHQPFDDGYTVFVFGVPPQNAQEKLRAELAEHDLAFLRVNLEVSWAVPGRGGQPGGDSGMN